MEGTKLAYDTTNYHEKAIELLKADAEKIIKLIRVQMDHLTMPQCPLYEEVLDTQMFGLSREIDFATRLGIIDEQFGKNIMSELERQVSALHEAYSNSQSDTNSL
ncbi:MAG: YlaN family protein [Bacillaceae bacterium]